MELQPINDELMVPCAFCARKHLSAAIAYYADSGNTGRDMRYTGVLVARALINLCEADEGYDSHRPFAIGLLVKAEQECTDTDTRNAIRRFRLDVCDRNPSSVFPGICPTELEWSRAHACEAEREFPDIRSAIEREPFYRDNMSESELRQAEVNYRLAQLRWLDENIFGTKPVEKGEEQMACNKAKKATAKGGKAMPAKGKASGKRKTCAK